MFEKKANSYFQLFSIIKSQTLSGCNRRIGVSKDFLPLTTSFFEKVENANINWDDQHSTIFTNMANIVMELVYTTKAGEKIMDVHMDDLNGIFNTFNTLVDNATEILSISEHRVRTRSWQSLFDQISFLQLIISNFKLFNGYADINTLFSYVNENWIDLVKRGLTKKVMSDFVACISYNAQHKNIIPKDKRVDLFIHVLDGSMKFEPQYEMKAVSYQIVPIDSDESFVSNIDSEYSKGYSLKSSN